METKRLGSADTALMLVGRIAVAALVIQGAAIASDLNGTWSMDVPKPSGATLHSFLVLHQDGTSISGQVIANGSVGVPIRGAHAEGQDTVFSINWGWNFRVRPEGANLRVVVSYDGGGRDEALAVPVPESDTRPPAALPVPAVRALPDNGLARTPPMGWNSWNHFAESVDDRVVRETADAMVATGMAAAGYTYVNIDDTWEGGRDAGGEIVPNRKFPDMKALADYVHRKGLKLGIYSSPGFVTCGGYEGSYGHEEQDAGTFAAWGIDYLKYDWCSAGRVYSDAYLRPVYQKMGEALQRCGRPIVYSLCEYGMGGVSGWGPDAGANLWRTTGDIQDNWDSMAANGFSQDRLAKYAAPGRWNDPDMLEVGNGGMSATEYRTHFSLWCMLAAPLIAGNDLRHMSPETIGILTNREVIAVDQDPLGKQGVRVSGKDGVEVWVKPVRGGQAVAVFNRNAGERDAAVTWALVGRSSAPAGLRDLWLHRDLAPAPDGYRGRVPGHAAVVLLLR